MCETFCSSVKYQDNFFPIAIVDQVWDSNYYNKLKHNFPNLNDFQQTNISQHHRQNIQISKKNPNIKILSKTYPMYFQLFQYISSKKFIHKIRTIFPDELCKSFGFKGSWNNVKVSMDLSISTDGYENPFHVDTRGRIVHILIYFGKDQIQKGGELCLAKHKPLNSWHEYPQIPKLDDIEQIKTFSIKDNFGVIVLSTPNSYHKGNKLKGLRKFIYISINDSSNKAWDCNGWFKNKKKFTEGLQYQIKSNPDKYKTFQKQIETFDL